MNEIVIHHLTDIHIGPLHYAASRKLPFIEAGVLPRNLPFYYAHLRDLSVADLPDLVVASGDLSSYADEAELNAAEDAIHRILELIRRKTPPWATGGKSPRIVIVPGNHDLDWGKKSPADKIQRYARMSSSLFDGGEVLSAVYHGAKHPVWWDSGPEGNLFVYLFNSAVLGGVRDPALQEILNTLSNCGPSHSALANSQRGDEFQKALDALEIACHKDPGYVDPDELQAMTEKMAGVPPDRFKIAVMHHNATSPPSDDVEAFDVIVNAGLVKAYLVRQRFDLVFHGHRHATHCGHERFLRGSTAPHHGIFFVGGDSFGCQNTAPFLDVRLRITGKADVDAARGRVLSVTEMTHRGITEGYEPRPLFEELAGAAASAAFGELLKSLGLENIAEARRRPLLETLAGIQPLLQDLQSKLVDWGDDSSSWITKFHFQLENYRRIYATDVYSRLSQRSPLFETYLREQYAARLKRLVARPEKVLRFSKPVYEAILRTGWEPDPTMWKDYTIQEAQDDDAADDLEIVRIHVRSDPLDGDCRDRDCHDLENTAFDHRVFGIPLFVIDVQSLPGRTRPRDFVIAFDRDGQVSNCYEFHDKQGKVVQRDNVRGSQLSAEFEEILANKALKTIGPQVMIGDSRVRRNFARNYDKTRRASLSIVEVLRRHLRPAPDKVGLDIGCGTGNYTLPFAGQFRELIGLDALDEMLAVARPKSDKIRWLLGDALNTGLEDASCDAVWLISTLHYFKGQRQKLLFAEIYRLLRPGGVVVADTEFLEQHASLWVVDFFPSLRNRYRDACLSVKQYDSWLRELCFTNVQFDKIDYNPTECDAALRIGQHEPRMYLRKEIRDGLPAFREMPLEELRKGLKRLEAAIADKSIDETIAAYRKQATMPGDVGFIVATR